MKAIGGWCGLLMGLLALADPARGAPETLAFDAAGNYTPATFVDGANLGTGFGAWDLWNQPADLGDSTAGGGGDLNSTNGYSFRFMGDGTTNAPNNWCNGKRNFGAALQPDDQLSFTFTYNYDGGGRGVDIFCATGQFANVIDVSPGDTFKVNGQTVSTQWSPGAVVAVEITQLADGIQVHLVRTTNGAVNLNYTTNILNPEPATGFSLYCGGYVASESENPNYAIFMNDVEIVGEPRTSLVFTDGVWNPSSTGEYAFALARSGAVGDELVLTSGNSNAVTVPPSATFGAGSNAVSFNATVASLTSGSATIVASNAASGAWAEYVVTPVPPVLSLSGPWQLFALGPTNYVLQRSGAVGDDVVLSSSDSGVLTVPASTSFAAGATSLTFAATAVGYGPATIVASNAASGAWATFDLAVAAPAIALTGPTTAWNGGVRYCTLYRNSSTAVGDTVALSSSDTNVLAVPATVAFPAGANSIFFQAAGLATGTATIAADNDDVAPATLDVVVADMPGTLAADDAGNYVPATFVDGANLGLGFGVWDLWNQPAELGDSTAGGGGDLNSTNGHSFRFMGDGAGGYCNARRNFAEALKAGDVVGFTFTYNWDGGNRGVDVFSAGGQFANLINVSVGNDFRVNGTTISTEWSPGAVVEVEIAQKADGIQVYLTRATNGTVNLAYTTNVVHGEGATGVSMYCGGYSDSPENNVNYAIFMNDLRIVGAVPTRLSFTGGTWAPAALGDYAFELTRSGAVTDDVVLTSDNPAAVTVPAATNFAAGSDVVSFNATVASLTAGGARIVASNAATGAWAEYNVYPVAPTLTLGGPWLLEGLGATNYTLTRSASAGTNVLLSSSNTNVLWVPVDLVYGAGYYETTFPATALAYGTTTITATDAVTGAWATYDVTVQLPANPEIASIAFNPATGDFTFAVPAGYDLGTVYGADTVVTNQYWDFQPLTNGVDYVVSGSDVVLATSNARRKIIRIGLTAQ